MSTTSPNPCRSGRSTGGPPISFQMMRKSGLGRPASCSHRMLTTPVGSESAPCLTAFVPSSDKLSNVRAVPIALYEKIVSFTKRTEAPAEASIEIIETLSLSSNLVCHALHNGKKILRSVRQLMHDEFDVLLVPSAHRDFRAQCQARYANADYKGEQKEKGLVEAAANERSCIRYRAPHRKA